MINIYYSNKGTPYVWASELHKELNIETPLRMWFPRMVEYGFVENEDFSQQNKIVQLVQGGSNVKHNWAVQLEMAKHISMIQRSEKGKAMRKYLISLDNKVQEGKLLTHQQVDVLFELCEVFGLFSVQKYLESEHYKKYENKNENWWRYRARILGSPKSDLKEMMTAIGKKYENQRQALFHIDKYELIRRTTFDLFKAMGKSDEYAKNVGDFTKKIAKKLKPDIYNDVGMSIDFKTKEQKDTINKIENKDNPDGLVNKFIKG